MCSFLLLTALCSLLFISVGLNKLMVASGAIPAPPEDQKSVFKEDVTVIDMDKDDDDEDDHKKEQESEQEKADVRDDNEESFQDSIENAEGSAGGQEQEISGDKTQEEETETETEKQGEAREVKSTEAGGGDVSATQQEVAAAGSSAY